MLKGFYCPDKQTTLVEDCLASCRLGERCLTLPTLKLISQEREWKGLASTTQLLEGTMLTFLKLTQDYFVDPDSRAFMLQGTKHHKALEEVAKELGLLAEIPLSGDRDIFDLIEVEDGKLILTDLKLWGSFRVAKALGIEEIGKQVDPSGEVYKTTSKYGKEGSPKMIPVFKQNPDKAENWEAELQLNRYRVKLEDLGLKIDKMQLQITVRDGGLYIAHQRGIFRNTYILPIKFLEDSFVKDYFEYKSECLRQALEQGYWESPCTPQESWGGNRCKDYCDVAKFCSKGQLVKSINASL